MASDSNPLNEPHTAPTLNLSKMAGIRRAVDAYSILRKLTVIGLILLMKSP